MQLANSKNGTAIFSTGNLAPGQQVTGSVQLSNTGSGAGDLDLTQADLVDTPGPGLGALSGALQLSVRDVTNAASLGSLPAGQTRTYSFTAVLPSSGGNTVSGASMSVRYVWRLTGPESGGGTIAGGGSGSGGVSAMPVTVKVNVKKAVKSGLIAVSVKCGEPCALNAYAAAKGRPAVRTRRKIGRVKVAGKSATIKLKLSEAGKKALVKRLEKKTLPLTVTVKAQDPRGAWKTVTKKVTVKRAGR